jgi:hypothetical protein
MKLNETSSRVIVRLMVHIPWTVWRGEIPRKDRKIDRPRAVGGLVDVRFCLFHPITWFHARGTRYALVDYLILRVERRTKTNRNILVHAVRNRESRHQTQPVTAAISSSAWTELTRFDLTHCISESGHQRSSTAN